MNYRLNKLQNGIQHYHVCFILAEKFNIKDIQKEKKTLYNGFIYSFRIYISFFSLEKNTECYVCFEINH
jgi:hypothetical protein